VDKYTVERVQPVGGLGTVGAVLSVSLGSGFVVAVGVLLLAWGLRWPARVALVVSGVTVIVVWVLALRLAGRAWFAVETVSPVEQGQQLAEVPVLRVEVHEPEAAAWRFLDLPGTSDQLSALARGMLAGRLAESDWTGRGGLYSRADFRALRGQLLDRGLLAWRNVDAPAQGLELTHAGRAVFTRLVELDQGARTHAHADQVGRFALGPGAG
jgi:hypothetical protein